MEILLARDMGFCWGVRRAIDTDGLTLEEVVQRLAELIEGSS